MRGPLSSRGESGAAPDDELCPRLRRQSNGKRAGMNILLNERERCAAVCVRPCTSDEVLCAYRVLFVPTAVRPGSVRPTVGQFWSHFRATFIKNVNLTHRYVVASVVLTDHIDVTCVDHHASTGLLRSMKR